MSISENLKRIKESIGSNTKLVVVSKTHPNSAIMEAYDEGQRAFGENKVQELVQKQEELPKDIEWHFIGHLQTNKVKYMAPFVSLIHAVDSLKLLRTINKEAEKNNRVIDCLLQFHIAREDSKFGLKYDDVGEMLKPENLSQLKNVRIVGVMGMATFTDDDEQIRQEFSVLKNIFEKLKGGYFEKNDYFTEISMGMSDDYRIAIEQGSTMVRIGSTIFGNRVYH